MFQKSLLFKKCKVVKLQSVLESLFFLFVEKALKALNKQASARRKVNAANRNRQTSNWMDGQAFHPLDVKPLF